MAMSQCHVNSPKNSAREVWLERLKLWQTASCGKANTKKRTLGLWYSFQLHQNCWACQCQHDSTQHPRQLFMCLWLWKSDLCDTTLLRNGMLRNGAGFPKKLCWYLWIWNIFQALQQKVVKKKRKERKVAGMEFSFRFPHFPCQRAIQIADSTSKIQAVRLEVPRRQNQNKTQAEAPQNDLTGKLYHHRDNMQI